MKKSCWKKKVAKRVLRLPDLDYAKGAVLNTLGSPESKRAYEFAIDDFVSWYCSELRLAFNKTVVLRYRLELEGRRLSPATINLRLAGVRRLAYEAADIGLLSPELAAGIRRVKGAKQDAYHDIGGACRLRESSSRLAALCADEESALLDPVPGRNGDPHCRSSRVLPDSCVRPCSAVWTHRARKASPFPIRELSPGDHLARCQSARTTAEVFLVHPLKHTENSFLRVNVKQTMSLCL